MPLFPIAPVRNRLLASLAPDVLAALLPKLTFVALNVRQTIYNPDDSMDAAYFPEAGMISLVANLDDGMQAEVGVIGREGMLGLSFLSGAERPFVESMVQMPGSALRMSAKDVRQEIDGNAPFRTLLLRYHEALQAQAMQTAEDRAERRFEIEMGLAVKTGRATNERWHMRKDGTRFWASGMMMPMLDGNGQPLGFLNILRDRTEARAEVERRELLMAEMNHRIKNAFSMVQAVAARTRRHAATLDDFQRAFAERLLVLARSNDILIRADWDDAPLRDVIETVLAVHAEEPGRITLHGPSVLLPANVVTTVSLAFHELATNAVKYGSLSVPDGQVVVSWTLVRARGCRHVKIIWRESGGPRVRRPTRRGFGTQLLEQGLPTGGEVRMSYRPAGLECSMRLPLGVA